MKYQEFVSIEMKKRPEGTKPKDYMAVVAKKWHAQKEGGGVLMKIRKPKKGKGIGRWFKRHVLPIVQKAVPIILKAVDLLTGTDLARLYDVIKNVINAKTVVEKQSAGRAATIYACQQLTRVAVDDAGLGKIPGVGAIADKITAEIVGGIYDALVGKGGSGVDEREADLSDFIDEIFAGIKSDDRVSSAFTLTARPKTTGGRVKKGKGADEAGEQISASLKKYKKTINELDEYLKHTDKKNGVKIPAVELAKWNAAVAENNGPEIERILKKYGPTEKQLKVAPPSAPKSAYQTLMRDPAGVIQAYSVLNKMNARYSPAGLLQSLLSW